jgi:hypothetical protein
MKGIECDCLQTHLQDGPTCSVPFEVTAMNAQTRYSDDFRPALARVNNQPKRTARWPEEWMIHRPDGSFALYLVNWGIRLTADVQPTATRLPELTVPDGMTALSFPQPANEGSKVLEWLHE